MSTTFSRFATEKRDKPAARRSNPYHHAAPPTRRPAV